MPMLVADIPQYMEVPAYVEAHVAVASAHNWNLDQTTAESPLVLVVPLEPKAADVGARRDPPVDYSACATARGVLYFSTGQSVTTPELLTSTLSSLPKQCAWDVAGFADPRGTARYNYKLGMRRAEGVADWLLDNGYAVWPAVSYGKTRLVSGGNPSGFKKDRRVEIVAGPWK
jgi:outer membrane protein OmpA-like peptidoglycan-associated protein